MDPTALSYLADRKSNMVEHGVSTPVRVSLGPPRKCEGAAMGEWKDRLAQHVLQHLLRRNWRLECRQGEIVPRG
jgi:hypothetical protein